MKMHEHTVLVSQEDTHGVSICFREIALLNVASCTHSCFVDDCDSLRASKDETLSLPRNMHERFHEPFITK